MKLFLLAFVGALSLGLLPSGLLWAQAQGADGTAEAVPDSVLPYDTALFVHILDIRPGAPLNFTVFHVDRYKDSTTFKVIVQDTAGRFIRGIADSAAIRKQIFRGIQDRRGRPVCRGFEVVEASEDSLSPLNPEANSFAMVLDYSGSMLSYFDPMEESAQDFVARQLPGDSIAVVKFDHSLVTTPLDSLAEFPAGSSGLGGSTALFAAADQGVKELSASAQRRLVVLFTDGYENSSGSLAGLAHTGAELAKRSAANNTRIYAFGLGLPYYQLLRDITTHTGGHYYPIEEMDDFLDSLQHLRRQFSNYYQVTCKCRPGDNCAPALLVVPGKKLRIKDREKIEFPVEGVNFGVLRFPFDEYTIRRTEARQINRWVPSILQFLYDAEADTAYTDRHIEIHGHTSPEGYEAYNRELSYMRSKAIREYIEVKLRRELKKMEAPSMEISRVLNNLQLYYHGPDQPLYPADDRRNRDNRRVEIIGVADGEGP